MLSVTRSPLTSPALRTVVAHSAFPFDHAIPSSPHSRLSSCPLPQINLPVSPRASSPNLPNSHSFGGYFNLTVPSPSHHHLCVPGSPRFLVPPQMAVRTPPTSDRGSESSSISPMPKVAPVKLTVGRDPEVAQSPTGTRRRPSFVIEIPRPTIMRDDSFEAVALAGLAFTPGTPGELKWSDSFDSVVTLKPTKGRVSTPYPKSEGWIANTKVVKEDIQTRLARLL